MMKALIEYISEAAGSTIKTNKNVKYEDFENWSRGGADPASMEIDRFLKKKYQDYAMYDIIDDEARKNPQDAYKKLMAGEYTPAKYFKKYGSNDEKLAFEIESKFNSGNITKLEELVAAKYAVKKRGEYYLSTKATNIFKKLGWSY